MNISTYAKHLLALSILAFAAGAQAAIVSSIASPAGFSPGATTINFDSAANNAVVNALYASQGVQFSRDDAEPIKVADWTALGRMTTSPNNVLATISNVNSSYVDYVNLNFSAPQNEVGSYFGNDQDSRFSSVTLSLYDSLDLFLGSVTVVANNNTHVDQFIGLRSDTAFSRARFQVNQSALSYAVVLDDVIFGAAVPVPLPSTALLLTGGILALFSFKRRANLDGIHDSK